MSSPLCSGPRTRSRRSLRPWRPGTSACGSTRTTGLRARRPALTCPRPPGCALTATTGWSPPRWPARCATARSTARRPLPLCATTSATRRATRQRCWSSRSTRNTAMRTPPTARACPSSRRPGTRWGTRCEASRCWQPGPSRCTLSLQTAPATWQRQRRLKTGPRAFIFSSSSSSEPTHRNAHTVCARVRTRLRPARPQGRIMAAPGVP
mmetsp:Transcript_36526/g.86725  ORF Transcript_36526/g.86725 Transcript_36526/m.86725 type:complete len:209 (-) Transcript_36526:98-724(-)